MTNDAISVKFFPALNGDCFLINMAGFIILIDGGYINTYNKFLKPELHRLQKEGKSLSYLIVTHIDGDHISGINRFLEENISDPIIGVENIWHNAYRHIQHFAKEGSVYESLEGKSIALFPFKPYLKEEKAEERDISAEQGSVLAALILKAGYRWNADFDGKSVSVNNLNTIHLNSEITLRLLSPDNDKLEALYKYWRKELYKMGYATGSEDESFFDDAFEFLAAQEKEQKTPIEKDIAHREIDIENLADVSIDEDTGPVNGSSIAFILEIGNKKLLFLGDAHPSLVAKELKKHYGSDMFPIKFELIKLSHHGSAANTSKELLELIDSESYIFSTNGKSYNHPDWETIARVISRKVDYKRYLFFNYPLNLAKVLNESRLKEKYNYELVINDGNNSIEVNL